MEGGKLENPEKNPQRKARTNNKLSPHMATGRNQTHLTVVRGEHYHQFTIPAAHKAVVKVSI